MSVTLVLTAVAAVPAKYTGYSSTDATLFGGVAGRLKRLAEETKK